MNSQDLNFASTGQQVHYFTIIITVKVHPRTGHESPDGEQMDSSTLPSTSALDAGGC